MRTSGRESAERRSDRPGGIGTNQKDDYGKRAGRAEMTHVNLAMTTLLNGIWEGTFLAVAMFLFLKLLPRLNPTTCFTVLWVTLLAIVALLLGPFALRAFLPGAQMHLSAIAAHKPTTATLAPVPIEEPKFNLQNSDISSESHPVSVPKSNPELVSERASELVEARNGSSPSGSIAKAADEHPLIRIHSGRMLGAVEIMWALLSFVMLARLGFGYRKLRGLKADSTPAPAEWQRRLRSLSGTNGVRRQMQLLVSNHV